MVGWLAVVGLSLKAVQDFYSNSNWVELHPRNSCGCFATTTYTTVANSASNFSDAKYSYLRTGCEGSPDKAVVSYFGVPTEQTELTSCTGPLIGDPCSGMNKRSAERPLFEEAYSLAFAQSVEWILACEAWTEAVNKHMVKFAIKNFVTPYHRNTAEFENAYIHSLADVAATLQHGTRTNGIWKGSASGDLNRMTTAFRSFFLNHFSNSQLATLFGKGLIREVTSGLYNMSSTPSSASLSQVPTLASYTQAMSALWGETKRFYAYKVRVQKAAMLHREWTNVFAPSLVVEVTLNPHPNANPKPNPPSPWRSHSMG